MQIRRRGGGSLKGGPLVLSCSVHILALVGLWTYEELRPPTHIYETIQVRVVSAPPAAAEEEEVPPAPEEELVVETPDEPEPVPEEEAPVVVEEEPEPEPEETPPPPVEETPPPPEDTPAPAADAEADVEDGGEDIDVRLEGLRRDFPQYYGNIITQMRRCFRPPDRQNREATIRFLIHRDGSTSDYETVRSSGSFAFDIEAQGAVECAGRPGRIGPLPEDFPWDVLPIEFTFSPSRGNK